MLSLNTDLFSLVHSFDISIRITTCAITVNTKRSTEHIALSMYNGIKTTNHELLNVLVYFIMFMHILYQFVNQAFEKGFMCQSSVWSDSQTPQSWGKNLATS